MSYKDVNEDSNSFNDLLDVVKTDPDVFGVVTTQELEEELTGQSSHDDSIADDDNSQPSNAFNALLDAVSRDPEVFGIERAHNLEDEVSVQPDHDEPVSGDSSMELNACEMEPLNPGGVPFIQYSFQKFVEIHRDILYAIKEIKEEPEDVDSDADTLPINDDSDESEMSEDIPLEIDENRDLNDEFIDENEF